MKKTDYIPSLDVLRAFAVIGVVFHHYSYVYNNIQNKSIISSVLIGVSKMGWVGVDLFFVLSGFLITRILLNQKTERNYFKRFYFRRSLRIFPLYYAVLFIYFAVPPLLNLKYFSGSEVIKNQIWLWTYTSNIPYPKPIYGDLFHLWSLSVEEHFYLIWPLVVYKLRPKALFLLCLTLIGVIPILRFGLLTYGIDFYYLKFNTLCRIDTLLFGCTIALLEVQKNTKENYHLIKKIFKYTTGIVLLYFLGCLLLNSEKDYLWESIHLFALSLFALWFFCIVFLVSWSNNLPSIFKNKVLIYIGKISYGVYIFHLPAQRIFDLIKKHSFNEYLMDQHLFSTQMLTISLQLLLTLTIAAASWHFFESYFLKLKNRF